MHIAENIKRIQLEITGKAQLVAVSKTKPVAAIQKAYNAGQRIFGENKVQEMAEKQALLPSDIAWHLIGHLQTNKVKYIAPFVSLIQSVDSLRLLQEIDKQGEKHNRVINCLLQIYIAQEDTKFGLSFDEATALLNSMEFKAMQYARIVGLMGMASNTANEEQVRNEFASLAQFFKNIKKGMPTLQLHTLSMGMSGDYLLAIAEGSNLVRVGSAIFGERSYD
jgi:hypothetical protein